MKEPKVIERFTDNGEHSHYELIDVETHEVLWSEDTEALSQHDVSGSTFKSKPIWRKCTWYKHQFTNDALELSITFTGTWWALYGKINRYSDVVDTEVW